MKLSYILKLALTNLIVFKFLTNLEPNLIIST